MSGSAYGGIFTREIGEEYIVDSGHLVAYEPSIRFASAWRAAFHDFQRRGPGDCRRRTRPD